MLGWVLAGSLLTVSVRLIQGIMSQCPGSTLRERIKEWLVTAALHALYTGAYKMYLISTKCNLDDSMLRIIQASQLFQYNTTKPLNYLTWNCTITCPVSKHLILYYDGKTNYMYSEKSDGCMNSCIVDNSLVCGIMELYYGFLKYTGHYTIHTTWSSCSVTT